MTQFIKKLPAVFQTVTEKKFFDATFDQVFSKKDGDQLSGYIGRRTPGLYNPVSDFYLPEPSKDRTWWQLEATGFSRNTDNTKSNIFFYDDLLNRINYYGGNTLNQDRLFESEYYSWAPPIDFDMFINYHNYYWVFQGLAAINVTGISDTQITSMILGAQSFNTSSIPGALPANLTFTTGLTIQFVGSTLYPDPLIVENIGVGIGIRLVPRYPDYTPGTVLEFLPWDGTTQLSNGRVIQNTNWDTLTWDVQPQPGNCDYITIERGAIDRNAWSRTNKWVHIDAINATVAATGIAFPTNATRALRPIIQFSADLFLYNSGTQFRADVTFGFRDNEFGIPLQMLDYQLRLRDTVNEELQVEFTDGQLVVFMNDTTLVTTDLIPWDRAINEQWDLLHWDGEPIVTPYISNQTIYQVRIDPDFDTVMFIPVPPPIVDGDIILISEDAPWDGAQRGETWYYDINEWVQAANDKVAVNQPPLFQLYDHNGVPLDDVTTYPLSTFAGSKIFSYKVNPQPGATVDPVLRFPIVYTSLGQSSDIMFQNDLITDRYVYSSARVPIDGYYYYMFHYTPVMYNDWNLFTPVQAGTTVPVDYSRVALSKQRVIDKFAVGYGVEYQFRLSVVPYNYPAAPDIIVSVNGVEVKNETHQLDGYYIVGINNDLYVDLETYLTNLLAVPQAVAPVVEIQTYTRDMLDPAAPGYSAIPQQLEANPIQQEVGEISASNLIEQFSSIIYNQAYFSGVAFGGTNNYRDTTKNRSVGSFILQNVAPTLKSMLVSSDDNLDVIAGIRFSQSEYTKFKNKYLQTALQLINQEFNPVQYHNNTIVISAWVDAIIKTINISKEFSNAFAYSYMIANGTPFATETHVVPVSQLVTLDTYLDLDNPRSALYIYDISGHERILTIGVDYEIISTNLAIEIKFDASLIGKNMFVALYTNPVPAYIPAYVPSTPTKVGAYSVYIPRIELDTSYTIPTNVIIGHDGSKTIAYGDYRDQLLLELEKRIYNLLQYRFRNEYHLPLRLEDVKSGYFRQTRYSRAEFLDITQSYLNKWTASNKANYHVNDWLYASADLPTNSPQLWKLYNYAEAVTPGGTKLNLPGNWKGIFQYYYDTIYPNTRPWEMLGFSSQPVWWVAEYGTNWSSTNTALWADLELGMIRQGPTAIFDPETLLPQVQEMWARPGLSTVMPVDTMGNIIPVPTIFNVAMSGNMYAPFDGFDNPWVYGDGAPVEQAWMSTSGYAFSVQEFLYLMKPGPFGELLFDTIGTDLSPGLIDIPGVYGPVMSNNNWQYVQNDTFTDSDPFFAWMRPKNATQVVHAESVDGTPAVRFGYQRWISDRLLFLGQDISTVFGNKVRTLDVNLANKFAGFTNKDTVSTYIESVSPTATTTSLLVPTNNFQTILHKGQPIKTYAYSGVIIRVSTEGKFVVYGYDLLNSEFTILDRSNAQIIDITIGGTPAEFHIYTLGETYTPGEIVRYNGVYYTSIGTIVAGKFNIDNWQKLRALPTIGGSSVIYRPISEVTSHTIPYGTILDTPQDVFDFLIGWGAYLESQGWQFTDVSIDTNQISDWLYSAKQFLFWINTNWMPDSSIQLSPAANNAMLVVERGYPNDVETIANGVYSILDKYGIAIPPNSTVTDRDNMYIAVSPADLQAGGIYFLQVSAAETEHVLIFDNTTSFNDIVYDPLLRARQQRLKFTGARSNAWFGKKEAPGYLILDNELVPNFNTIVDSMRFFYDPDVLLDNPSLEALGQHLIGYESKSYLDNLQVSNDVQYLFYQGAIRQKGTRQAFDKLFRSTKVQDNETIEVYEEWALKLSDLGNTIEQVSTEFVLTPEQNSGEVIVARLNFIPSNIGFVREVNIVNAQNRYTSVPRIAISLPDADPTDPGLTGPLRPAKAFAVLDALGKISRVDMTDKGYGYLSAPNVTVESTVDLHQLDRLYAVWQGQIARDEKLDNVVDIDVDDVAKWIVRPNDPAYSLEFPTTTNIEYSMPNAGYVNFNDVTWTSFDPIQTQTLWGTRLFNPAENDTVWVAKTFTEDWDVYKMVNIKSAPYLANTWRVAQTASDLLLLTDRETRSRLDIIPPSDASANANITDGIITNFIIVNGGSGFAVAPTVEITGACITPASAIVEIADGVVTSISIVNGGSGYAVAPEISITGACTTPASALATIAGGVINGIYIASGGSGYTVPPTVTAVKPSLIGGVITATAIGGIVGNLTIVVSGSGYTSAPILTIAPPVTTRAEVTLSTADGVVTGVTIVNGGTGYSNFIPPTISVVGSNITSAQITIYVTDGVITSATIDDGGSGYLTPPSLVITGPCTTPASLTCTTEDGVVNTATITEQGGYYTTIPVITVVGGFTYHPAVLNAVIVDGKLIDVDIVDGGSYFMIPPTCVVDAPIAITATGIAGIVGGIITSVSITNPGAGYSTNPVVTLPVPAIVDASFTSTINNGVINKVTITEGGSGYTTTPTITITGSSTTPAVLYPEITDGILTSIELTNPGGYYTVTPEIIIDGPCTETAKVTAIIEYGVITGFTITNGGSGYEITPIITIEQATQTATGYGAVLYPTVDDNGYITSVTIVDQGTGYSSADVIVASRAISYDPGYVDAKFQITSVTNAGQIVSVAVVNQGSGYQNVVNQEILPQLSASSDGRTDYGNMICLQIVIDGKVDPATNYAVRFEDNGLYTDPTTLISYNSYKLLNVAGDPIQADEIGVFEFFTDLLLFKTMRWTEQPIEPLLPKYVGLGDLIWVDDIANKWAVVRITADPGYWDITYWDPTVKEFWAYPYTYDYGWDTIGPMYFTPYRVQETLINTSLFSSAQVFQRRIENELVLLPVYDPFKAILPGPAKQNITYMLLQDPARYNVTGDARLYSENIIFGEPQVGKLWWDMSSMRYAYYEQPAALDGSETPTQNLVYRRDRWGQMFPGSSVDIYEWVKSPVPPAKYAGSGTPRSLTTYVRIESSNRFTNITEVNYYFWVLNPISKPVIENRTLAALDVSRLLFAPRSQQFVFFSPIQQSEINNSYMFYNVQEILAYKGDNVQIKYRLAERNDQEHSQWKLFREGDTASLITDQFWNKMVDSICAYTKVLPASEEWSNSIFVGHDLPWDIYGWDIAPWDDAIDTVSAFYGEVLPVPDPSLSEAEKFGITYRPRQGMFMDLYAARKIFVQAGNNLLKRIAIRDKTPDWNTGVKTSEYWDYTTWYELGYDDVAPSVVFTSLTQATTALNAGKLNTGAIVEVIEGTPDGRYVLYAVVQLNTNVATQSFLKVGIEASAIKLLDTIYTTHNVYGLSVELRELLKAFRTEVFVNSYVVFQNELYFAMLNYVFSEQKNQNWAFKSSYIYIKENNIPIKQSRIYQPDQINNIMSYIVDSKPYHTQIRDYTSTHLISDIATGTAFDNDFKLKTIIQFGPDFGGPYENGNWDVSCEDPNEVGYWEAVSWDVCPENYSLTVDPYAPAPWEVNCIDPLANSQWDTFWWDTCLAKQFVAEEDVYTIELTNFDASKIGYSQLYPYTFDFNSINLNNPQTFITPSSVVSVTIGADILLYGKDYYVEYNEVDLNYTAYFFAPVASTPVALVLWNGGGIMRFNYGTNRTEVAYGFPKDDFVVNVDTRLPVNNVGGILHPYAPWGDSVSDVDPLVAAQIVAAGGSPIYNPADPVTLEFLPVTVSYRQNLGIGQNHIYRNSELDSGILMFDLPAPSAGTDYTEIITVFIDPLTHPITTDILPNPGPSSTPGVIWINGERIEYRSKTESAANTWELSLVRRGTNGTAPVEHTALVPSFADPLTLVPNIVWIEKFNELPAISNSTVWNAVDPAGVTGPGQYDFLPWDSYGWDSDMYTNITKASDGGIWYAATPEAEMLKREPGTAIL